MSERAQAQLRALKEAAQVLFVQGRYAECAEVHSRILRMVPKDPNARVRHAEICRRAGDRQTAIASYRTAAELLLAQGCEARARASLRAALELDPRDPVLLSDFTRMGQATLPPSTALEDERLYSHVTVSEAPVAVAPRTEARVKTPPPPPPPFVLRAAEETRASGPLPSAPAIAPVKVKPPGPVTQVPVPSTPAIAQVKVKPPGAVNQAPVPSAPAMPSSFPPRGAVAPRQVEAPREVALPVVKGTLVPEQSHAAPRPGVPVAPSKVPHTPTTLSPAKAPRTVASTPQSPSRAPQVTASATRPPSQSSASAPLPPAQAPRATASAALLPVKAPHTAASSTLSPAQALHATASAGAPVPRETPKVEVSASLWTTGAPVTVTPVTAYRPELRWLSPTTVALRASPQSHWVIIRADGPLSLSRMETLPVPARDVSSPAPVAAIEDSSLLIAH